MLWLTILLLILFDCSMAATALRLRKQDKMTDVRSVTAGLVSYTILVSAVLLLRLDIPYYVLYLGLLSFWIGSFFGYGQDKFQTSVRFDRYLHVLGTFSAALLTYCLIRNFVQEGGSRLFRALFVWALGGFIGAAFEILEFRQDKKNGTRHQHGLQDTDTDLIADIIGSFLAAVFAFFFLLS